MSKFKVGDRVRVLVDYAESSSFLKGHIGKITVITPGGNFPDAYTLDDGCYVYESSIELVETPKEEKLVEATPLETDGQEVLRRDFFVMHALGGILGSPFLVQKLFADESRNFKENLAKAVKDLAKELMKYD